MSTVPDEEESRTDVTTWEDDLRRAGWSQYKGLRTVWRHPNGSLYRGPYAAWQVMNAEQRKCD
jgi:hypothetical protein